MIVCRWISVGGVQDSCNRLFRPQHYNEAYVVRLLAGIKSFDPKVDLKWLLWDEETLDG